MPQLQYSDPKSQARKPTERHKALGQVFTPDHIASEMVCNLLVGREKGRPVSILDPCVGPCTFPKNLLGHNLVEPEDIIVAVDLDEKMVSLTRGYLKKKKTPSSCRKGDYLFLSLENAFDYAILNPPYIRQEWIEKKNEYRALFKRLYDIEIPGTSNLYAYFLVKVIKDLKPGGRFSCIVYDSWQFTRFGQWLIKFINSECSEVTCKPVGGQPFEGRLIDATIICGTKKMCHAMPSIQAEILEETRNGYASGIQGFSTIDDLFHSKRGLRLKQADFFMCDLDEGKAVGATPFVKKVSSIKGFVVPSNHPESALLIGRGEANPSIMSILKDRIKAAEQDHGNNISVLTWYKERPFNWYVHTPPPTAPIIFNYYMRKRPRHILNDRCYSDNFYGLTPRTGSPLAWLAILNSTAVCVETLSHARTQGGGLSKIQLFEYRQVSVPDLASFKEEDVALLEGLGLELISSKDQGADALAEIDNLIFRVFGDERLAPGTLWEVLQTFQS